MAYQKRTRWCVVCSEWFLGKEGSKTCSAACRKRLSRGVTDSVQEKCDKVKHK